MKKAIEPLIAWILLIGFSVAMAAFISNWVIQQTKETFQPEKFLESISCEGVSFSITDICKESSVACTDGTRYNFKAKDLSSGVKIKNKGAFTIKNITIMPLYDDTKKSNDFGNGGLLPGEDPESISPVGVMGNICIKAPPKKNEIKLIPVIEKEDKVHYCTDNAVILNNEAITAIPLCTT